MDVDTEEHENVNSPIVNEKIIQTCPNWVKITEIPHPALVPSFISRRECLPDGSIDPNTQSVSTQINLLCASSLSPSLAGVIGNIPSGMMCEAIYKNNLREVRGEEIEALKLKEGYSLSHSPEHYKRTSDPNLINFNNTTTTVNQTTSELSSINILYGGVRGKAYLDSLKTFTQGIDGLKRGSEVENILMERVGKIEAGCGFKIFNIYEINEIQKKCNLELYNEFMISAHEIINSTTSDFNSEDSFKIIIDQNNCIIKLLNTCQLFQAIATENSEFLSTDSSLRKSLLERLKGNLAKLVERCPEEIKKEKFRGVNVNI